MSDMSARLIYKVDHSEIRGREGRGHDRQQRLSRLCDERQFWLGDQFFKPDHVAAQAALKVLSNRNIDSIAYFSRPEIRQAFNSPSAKKQLVNIRRAFTGTRSRPVLP